MLHRTYNSGFYVIWLHQDAVLSLQAGLNMLTRCQGLGYGPCGILCVSIHPGDVKTDLGVEQVAEIQDAGSRAVMVDL